MDIPKAILNDIEDELLSVQETIMSWMETYKDKLSTEQAGEILDAIKEYFSTLMAQAYEELSEIYYE